jgi:hypothetical protein
MGCWLLAAGWVHWVLAAGWLLGAGCWLLAAGSGCGCVVGCGLRAARGLLAAGCELLAADCWLLAAGIHVLQHAYTYKHVTSTHVRPRIGFIDKTQSAFFVKNQPFSS